jgi:hypothetical protein
VARPPPASNAPRPLGPVGILVLPLGELHPHVTHELLPVAACPFGQGAVRLTARLLDRPRRYSADVQAICFDCPAVGEHSSEIEHTGSAAIVDVDHHASVSRQNGSA